VPAVHVEQSVPELFVSRKLGGRKALFFEALFSGCFCEALADSGASHSFVSVYFLQDNQLSFQPVAAPNAALADGSVLPIVGIARNMRLEYWPLQVC
jgi:hypothetical protein